MSPFGSSRPHMRDKYATQAPLLSGETVAPGAYRCCECGYDHKIEHGIVNLKIGGRVSTANGGSFYVGWGTALTDNVWYDHILRFEYRTCGAVR